MSRPRGACRRCDGLGILPEFRHRDGGVCFACRGTGSQRDVDRATREKFIKRALWRREVRAALVRCGIDPDTGKPL